MNRLESPSPAGARAFGVNLLLELFDGDRAAVADMLAAGIRAIEADLLHIERACSDRNARALVEAAHSLKGASASLGCARITELSASLERAGNAGLPAGPPPLGELRAAVDALLQDIADFARESAP